MEAVMPYFLALYMYLTLENVHKKIWHQVFLVINLVIISYKQLFNKKNRRSNDMYDEYEKKIKESFIHFILFKFYLILIIN